MEQQDVCNAAVLGSVEVSDAIRQWVIGRSVGAAEVRQQVASIVRFLDDLDAAMKSLEPEEKAVQLSQQVRAEMIYNLLVDATAHRPDGHEVVGCHPISGAIPDRDTPQHDDPQAAATADRSSSCQ